MVHTACLVWLVSIVGGCQKNPLEEQALVNEHKTKLEQTSFLRYLWYTHINTMEVLLHWTAYFALDVEILNSIEDAVA
jgi:hypothetical protein